MIRLTLVFILRDQKNLIRDQTSQSQCLQQTQDSNGLRIHTTPGLHPRSTNGLEIQDSSGQSLQRIQTGCGLKTLLSTLSGEDQRIRQIYQVHCHRDLLTILSRQVNPSKDLSTLLIARLQILRLSQTRPVQRTLLLRQTRRHLLSLIPPILISPIPKTLQMVLFRQKTTLLCQTFQECQTTTQLKIHTGLLCLQEDRQTRILLTCQIQKSQYLKTIPSQTQQSHQSRTTLLAATFQARQLTTLKRILSETLCHQEQTPHQAIQTTRYQTILTSQ